MRQYNGTAVLWYNVYSPRFFLEMGLLPLKNLLVPLFPNKPWMGTLPALKIHVVPGSTTVQRCGSTTVLRCCGTMCTAHVFFLRWACFCSKSAASFILKQALDGDASRAENPRGTGSTTVQRCGSTMVLRCRGTACTARSFFLTMGRFRSKICRFLYSRTSPKGAAAAGRRPLARLL